MDIRISHSCPSCGAPLEIREADRLCGCSFCGVQNYLVTKDLQRFVLPDKIPEHIDDEDILYYPFLRFKGNIFTCQGNKIGYKVLDTTYQGINDRLVSLSLGLRPQAMQVSLVDKRLKGRFLRRKESKKSIFRRAALMAQAFSKVGSEVPYHRAFIGETVSCVYLPLYIENGILHDGVLNSRLGEAQPWLTDKKNTTGFQEEWQPDYLATICPQCGSPMQGQPDSLIMQCFNCESCCAEKNGKFVPVPYRLVPATSPNAVYLPFWRLMLETGGVRMRTLADLLNLTNQPVVVSREHQEKKLEFWIPAMKLRPKIFLSLAKNATLSQLKFPEGEKRMSHSISPATLPLSEALEALKSVVAETTVHRKKVFPKLPNMDFTLRQTTLVFLPFENTGHDLVQEHSALSVATSVVKFGRKL